MSTAYDFFLSYATLDDDEQVPGDESSRWITNFRKVLSKRLGFYLARQINHFFDRKDLDGNAPLTADIDAAIAASCAFVAISSPTYYARMWCEKERQSFIRLLGANPAEARRVFIIHTTDVDQFIAPKKWQQEFFPDVRGYFFYRVDENKQLQMLGFPTLDPKHDLTKHYYTEIERLARDLFARIKTWGAGGGGGSPDGGGVPDGGGGGSPVGGGAADGGPLLTTDSLAMAKSVGTDSGDTSARKSYIVYLADNSMTAHDDHEDLRSALTMGGYEVRSAARIGLKVEESESNSRIVEEVPLAFVQIVAPVLEPGPVDGGLTKDELQLAAARSAGLPLFRWRPVDLPIETATARYAPYREFALASDVRQQLLQTFKEDLLKELKDLQIKKSLGERSVGGGGLVILAGTAPDLMNHMGDVTPVMKDAGLGCYATDKPADALAQEDVTGYLVLYGSSSPEQVRDLLAVVRTLPKTRRSTLKVGIYFAPGMSVSERTLLYDLPDFQKINGSTPEALAEFAKSFKS